MIHAIDVTNINGQIRHVVEFDPTKSFTNKPHSWIADSLGLIPSIMFNPAHSHLNLWDALHAGYQHGGGLFVGEGEIDQDLSYTYPGDPPMKPLAKYTRGLEVAYQYQYGLMMVEKDGKLTPTRMD